MVNNTADTDLNDLIDDDDDDWEDGKTYAQILESLPQDWQLVKIFSYNYQVLEEIDEWCTDNCQGEYRRVNWGGSCSYSTGVMFEMDMDTILFKLRYGVA